jgi:ABC-type ATPase with predicted acetyltransferase domain
MYSLSEYYDIARKERGDYLKFIGDDIKLHDYELWCYYKGRDIKDPFNDKILKDIVEYEIDTLTEREVEMYGFICVCINRFKDIEKIVNRLGQYHYISEMLILRREDLLKQSS